MKGVPCYGIPEQSDRVMCIGLVHVSSTTYKLHSYFVGWAPLVVIAVMRLSNSSLFSFNFLTKLSIALRLN